MATDDPVGSASSPDPAGSPDPAAQPAPDPGPGPGPRPGPGRVASARVRIRWLLAVLAVMAILTGGWPLISRAVADGRRLTAGSSFAIGPGGSQVARVRVGPGWQMLQAESNPRQQYVLRAGPARVRIALASLPDGTREPELLAGIRRVLMLSHAHVSVGKPRPVTTPLGQAGFASSLTSGTLAGTAAVFLAPSGKYAIELMVLGPRRALSQVHATSALLIGSLEFVTVGVMPRCAGPGQLPLRCGRLRAASATARRQ